MENLLLTQIQTAGLPCPERERCVIPGRKFRHDLAWPAHNLLVEIQGGTWIQGRHSRGAGMESDCEKQALALLLGWRTLAVTGSQVRSGAALEWLRSLLTLPTGESCGPRTPGGTG